MQQDAYADHGSPEEGYMDPSITVPAQRLARQFEGRFAGYGGYRMRAAASKTMQMLLDEGVAESYILSEVNNRARPRDQKLWDFPSWVRTRAAEIAETTAEDGEVRPFDATWAAFRNAFRSRYLAKDADAAILADWKEDCRRRLGEETTLEELMGALLDFSSDGKRSDPKFASTFWPRNAWPYLVGVIVAIRKRKKLPTTIRLQDDGKPLPPPPVGYSLVEAARRVQEAKRSDPRASAAEVIAAYKRELENGRNP